MATTPEQQQRHQPATDRRGPPRTDRPHGGKPEPPEHHAPVEEYVGDVRDDLPRPRLASSMLPSNSTSCLSSSLSITFWSGVGVLAVADHFFDRHLPVVAAAPDCVGAAVGLHGFADDLELLGGDLHVQRQLIHRRQPAERVFQLAVGLAELAHHLHHVRGDVNRLTPS